MGFIDRLPSGTIDQLARARAGYWGIVHPYTFGASVAVLDREKTSVLLLQTKTNADSDMWGFPGGGIAPWHKLAERLRAPTQVSKPERFQTAALKELEQEAGITAGQLALFRHLIDTHAPKEQTLHGNRDTVSVYLGVLAGGQDVDVVQIRSREITRHEWFPLTEIPDYTHPAVRPAVDMILSRFVT